MRFFARELERAIGDRKQIEVATAANMPPSTLANYINDETGITVYGLTQLLKAFPKTPDKLALIIAHLKDEIPAKFRRNIGIIQLGKDGLPLQPPPWKEEFDAAIESIREKADKNKELREMILLLDKMLK